MPKVNDAHIDAQKGKILDAARRVCRTAPVYRVTMRDIVVESGMSQGGVYSYFPNIDSVFVALLNETKTEREVREEVEHIVSTGASPGANIESLLEYLGRYTEAAAGDGIRLELMALYAREPERFARIKDQLAEVSELEYVQAQLRAIVLDGVAGNVFTPVVPVPDLLDFIHASIHGIAHTAIHRNHLSTPTKRDGSGAIHGQFAVLARAAALLLGTTP